MLQLRQILLPFVVYRKYLKSMPTSIIGIITALISTASWALYSIILKKLGERLEPVGITTINSVFSFTLLFVILSLTGSNLSVNSNDLLSIAISGICGIAIGDSLFFASLNRLSPLVLSVIILLGPVISSGIFGFVFFKEIPSLTSWAGIFTTLFGLSFLIFPIKNNENQSKTKITGLFFAFLTLICYAYAMVIIKPVLSNADNVITVTMYRMFFSAVVLTSFSLFSKKMFSWSDTLKDKKYSCKLLGTFTLATIGGFCLSLAAIKYCQLIVATSLMSLQPFFILLFMMIFQKYIPQKKEIFGIIASFCGIFLLCISEFL